MAHKQKNRAMVSEGESPRLEDTSRATGEERWASLSTARSDDALGLKSAGRSRAVDASGEGGAQSWKNEEQGAERKESRNGNGKRDVVKGKRKNEIKIGT